MIQLNRYKKFEGMYFRPGIIDDSITGMEWMELDYDPRSFKELTESCSTKDYFKELLTVLLIDTPNINSLSHSLGIFNGNSVYILSNEVYNKSISSILMYYALDSIYKTELKRIFIELSNNYFYDRDALSVLKLFNLKVNIQNNSQVDIYPIAMKKKYANTKMKFNIMMTINNTYINTIDIWYE